MAFSVYFSTSLKGGGMVQLFKRAEDKFNIKLQIQRWTPSHQRQEEREEGLAGDKAAVNLSCQINSERSEVPTYVPFALAWVPRYF